MPETTVELLIANRLPLSALLVEVRYAGVLTLVS